MYQYRALIEGVLLVSRDRMAGRHNHRARGDELRNVKHRRDEVSKRLRGPR